MNVQTLWLDSGHPNRPGTILTKVTGVVIHWTANESAGADAVGNRNYFNRKYVNKGGTLYETDGVTPFRYASAHINVDDHQYSENIPWRSGVAEMGYHVGATSYIPGICDKLGTTYPNNATIGIEICVNSDGDFSKAYANGVQVMAMVLKEHGLGLDAVIRHYDVTGKNCPAFFMDDTYGQKYFGKPAATAYAQFRTDVQNALAPAAPANNYYKVYQQGQLFKYQFATSQGAEDCAKQLFVSSSGKDTTIYATDPSLNVIYTPARHPEDFPQFVPCVTKERIIAKNGQLEEITLGDYSTQGTDVRFVKFPKGSFKLKFVWEPGKKVSELVQKYGATYGFNFPFFFDAGNNTYLPVADCKVGSQVISQGYDVLGGAQQTKWHGLAWKNGQPIIGELSMNDDYTDGFLVKTSPLLIDNGNACWDYFRVQDGTATDIGMDANGHYVRCQRTFIGLDKDGNLLLAAADGRTSSDIGLTLEEMSLFMASKGAVNALNGDGGSSTVLADQTGSLGQNSGSSEVVTHHAVLVYCVAATPAPAPTPTPSTPYYKVYQQGAIYKYQFQTEQGAEDCAKQLFMDSVGTDTTIYVTDPNGNVTYTPSKHPEDFDFNLHPIMGPSNVTLDQLKQFITKNCPSAPAGVAEAYFTVGELEGVKPEIALAQACWETNYFKFGGDVQASQNNFCGLGATGGVPGASFPDVTTGATAHVQHLKAYASKDNLSLTKVDPRFDLVSRGIAPYVENLGGKWAVPGYDTKAYPTFTDAYTAGKTYGQNIAALAQSILATVVLPPQWTLFVGGKAEDTFDVEATAEDHAKISYRQTKDASILVQDQNGVVTYTPAKHPEDFPDLIVAGMDDATQKAVYAYLKQKLGL